MSYKSKETKEQVWRQFQIGDVVSVDRESMKEKETKYFRIVEIDQFDGTIKCRAVKRRYMLFDDCSYTFEEVYPYKYKWLSMNCLDIKETVYINKYEIEPTPQPCVVHLAERIEQLEERIAELEKQEDENTYKSDNKSRYLTVGSVWRKYDDEFDSDEVYHAALFLVSNDKVKLMDIMDANRWYDEEYDLHGDDNKLKDMLSSRGWTYVGQMENVVTINVK